MWVAFGLFLIMDLNFSGGLFAPLVSDCLSASNERNKLLLPFVVLEGKNVTFTDVHGLHVCRADMRPQAYILAEP